MEEGNRNAHLKDNFEYSTYVGFLSLLFFYNLFSVTILKP